MLACVLVLIYKQVVKALITKIVGRPIREKELTRLLKVKGKEEINALMG